MRDAKERVYVSTASPHASIPLKLFLDMHREKLYRVSEEASLVRALSDTFLRFAGIRFLIKSWWRTRLAFPIAENARFLRCIYMHGKDNKRCGCSRDTSETMQWHVHSSCWNMCDTRHEPQMRRAGKSVPEFVCCTNHATRSRGTTRRIWHETSCLHLYSSSDANRLGIRAGKGRRSQPSQLETARS